MLSIIALIVSIVALAACIFSLGFLIGFNQRRVLEWLLGIQKEITRWKKQEEEADNESAVIETTPQLIRAKASKGGSSEEDSAIVTVKSPDEVRREKDKKLNEEIERLSRGERS